VAASALSLGRARRFYLRVARRRPGPPLHLPASPPPLPQAILHVLGSAMQTYVRKTLRCAYDTLSTLGERCGGTLRDPAAAAAALAPLAAKLATLQDGDPEVLPLLECLAAVAPATGAPRRAAAPPPMCFLVSTRRHPPAAMLAAITDAWAALGRRACALALQPLRSLLVSPMSRLLPIAPHRRLGARGIRRGTVRAVCGHGGSCARGVRGRGA
jgi:hypothetical protein